MQHSTQNHTPAFLKLLEIKTAREAAHGKFMAHRAEVEALQAARKRVESEIAHLEHAAPPPHLQIDSWYRLSREEADRIVKQHAKTLGQLAAKRDAERAALVEMLPDLDAGLGAARVREVAARQALAGHNKIVEATERAFTEIAGRAHLFVGL